MGAKHDRILALCMVAAMAAATLIGGTARQWAGPAQGGVWHEAGNWTPAGVPEAGDAVTLSGVVTVLLTQATAPLAAFTVESGATLLFTNSADAAVWLTADAATVKAGGNLSHAMWPPTNGVPAMSGQHAVRVAAETFTVESGAAVDVTARGYPGRPGRTPRGWGPGGGFDGLYASAPHSGGGGGHGGIGGEAYSGGAGDAYDDPFHPRLAGSGSCGGTSATAHGGHGGGVVIIEATNVVINGAIKVNGGDYIVAGQHPGAGSGGTIAIYCATLAGSGSLQAYGGNRAGEGGCGGGGCIAVHCDPVQQAALAVPAAITYSVSVGQGSHKAQGAHGTLFLTCQDLIGTDLMQRIECRYNASITQDRTQTVEPVKIYADGPFVLPALTLQANQRLGFMDIPGGVRIEGDLTLNTRSTFLCYAVNAPLTVEGDLVLNGNTSIYEYGILRLVAPPTLADPALAPTNLHVLGDIVVNNGGRIRTHPLDTRDAGVARVVCDGQVTVTEQGLITAMGAGYSGSSGKGSGYGPSPGYRDGAPGSGGASGGGHAGAGGKSYAGTLGGTNLYGSASFPLTAGSGAGCDGGRLNYDTWMATNAAGGGALWLQAGAVLNHGVISADAVNRATMARSGGGGGGSLLVQADRFLRAAGMFSANGAHGGQHSGGGGGGRVALRDWTAFNFEGSSSVAGGNVGTSPSQATTGTVGTLYIAGLELAEPRDLTVHGVPVKAGEWSPYGYGAHRLPPGIYTNFVGATVDEAGGARKRLLAWTLTDAADAVVASGVSTNVEIDLTLENLALTAFWTNQWLLSATASFGGSIVDNPAGWHDHAAEVTLTPQAESGFAFLMWAGAGVPAGQQTANPLTVAMDGARDIQAVFVSTIPTERVWSGSSGVWLDAARWDPYGIPGPNDILTITNGSVTISDPLTVGSLSINKGGTLTFSDWDTCLTLNDAFVVESGGLVNHLACGRDADPNHRVYVAADVIDIRAGGAINVDACGYTGGVCVVSGTGASGSGPGGGIGVNNSGCGGAHGGYGGINTHSGGYKAAPYGDPVQPTEPGSGGGSSSTLGEKGGAGGGVVRLIADSSLTVNGTISANGRDSYGGRSAGGAGGSVWLTCDILLGNGLVAAGGGKCASEAGSGGGGRIAVHYNPASQQALPAQPGVIFKMQSYDNNGGTVRAIPEDGGTLWFPDNTLFKGVVHERMLGLIQYVPRVELTLDELRARGIRLKLCGTNNVLTVNGPVDIRYDGTAGMAFGEVNFANQGILTVNGDVTISGTRSLLQMGSFAQTNGGYLNVTGNINVMTNGTLTYYFPTNAPTALQVGGNFGWSGAGGTIELIAAPTADPTNSPGGLLDWGAKDLTIPSGGKLRLACDGITGSAVWLRLDEFTVEAGATNSANGDGYWTGWLGHRDGYGPGGGKSGANSGGGGSYGGKGTMGAHNNSYAGDLYGTNTHVWLPGSGGGVMTCSTVPLQGCGGGGYIRVEARQVTVNGTICANGSVSTAGSHPGSGSGGGIYIRTRRLLGSGTGLLQANGRDYIGFESGAGGGGRIAVWAVRNDWAERESRSEVKGGLHRDKVTYAESGTVYWGVLPATGTVLMMR